MLLAAIGDTGPQGHAVVAFAGRRHRIRPCVALACAGTPHRESAVPKPLRI